MTSRVWKYLSVALVALAMVATVAGGSADAKKKGVGKSVDSSEIEDGTIVCADIAAAVFPNGCPDDDSGTAPTTPPASSGNVTQLNSFLIANQAKIATVGNFTLASSNFFGFCGWQITAGAKDSFLGFADGATGALPANTSTFITAGSETNFVAGTLDGTSTASGNVADFASGINCATGGFVTGV